MTWPHFLSFTRIAAGPVIAALILHQPGDTYLLAAIVFAAASLTDAVDGRLARHSDSVSPLGIFLDTTSDKIMVSLALIAMAVAGMTPAWIPLVIIAREFLISGLRSFAASGGTVISAGSWGKGKAAITMVAIIFVLVGESGKTGGALHRIAGHSVWSALTTAADWLLVLGAVLTIVSGIRYFVDAAPLFRAEPEAASEPPRRIAAGDGR